MSVFSFILWEAPPELFSIGKFAVRWYGLFFALGFLLGQQILIRIYKQEGKSEKHVDTLTVYMVIATILGARLGHCLFYEPEYYLSHPLDILKVWEGGLASHGATVGILIAIYLYSRKQTNQSYLYVLDRMVITIALAGCLIRLGNLMNSEIVGKPTDLKTAFLFMRSSEDRIMDTYPGLVKSVDMDQNKKDSLNGKIIYAGLDLKLELNAQRLPQDVDHFIQHKLYRTLSDYTDVRENVVLPEEGNLKYQLSEPKGNTVLATIKVYGIPRHPSQLYEAISSLFIFFLLFYIYNKKKGATPEGRIFSLFVIIIFGLRFLYEFLKEPQEEFERTMVLNMGQLLSIPLIIAGLFILMKSFRGKNEIS
jgi:phosphatidylglycerol:prolipoprotein diacylglycerol transferase